MSKLYGKTLSMPCNSTSAKEKCWRCSFTKTSQKVMHFKVMSNFNLLHHFFFSLKKGLSRTKIQCFPQPTISLAIMQFKQAHSDYAKNGILLPKLFSSTVRKNVLVIDIIFSPNSRLFSLQFQKFFSINRTIHSNR